MNFTTSYCLLNDKKALKTFCPELRVRKNLPFIESHTKDTFNVMVREQMKYFRGAGYQNCGNYCFKESILVFNVKIISSGDVFQYVQKLCTQVDGMIMGNLLAPTMANFCIGSL